MSTSVSLSVSLTVSLFLPPFVLLTDFLLCSSTPLSIPPSFVFVGPRACWVAVQMPDLLHLFHTYGMPNNNPGDIQLVNYVFIGDFVDRGSYSLEVGNRGYVCRLPASTAYPVATAVNLWLIGCAQFAQPCTRSA